MQFLNLALLALGASAMAIEQRADDADYWTVENFSSQHIAHGSNAVTEFKVVGKGFDTHCFHSGFPKSSNGLVAFQGAKCNDTSVTFGSYPTKGSTTHWVFSIHHGTVTNTIGATAVFYENAPHTGFTWQILGLPPSFVMAPKPTIA